MVELAKECTQKTDGFGVMSVATGHDGLESRDGI